ncbi:hypothetical protein ROLI_022680 [Roseobacter fucihabitans]|uniref:HTH cro/C1-type domain-containing protein n=1 Tax=Roseobacter fucihabitans TaxID=1537242 RepID=A0ABZ2BV33_9RHOB|nr:helix-turn-helix transcriptional regulator [Roseobacter litoralis]MBC6967459.1 Helix-turn-helix domain protein [Roseobacter litoralis]
MPLNARTPAELRNMFGANLHRLCAKYPSISALSRDLGINRTQFNRYLNGESFPRPDVLARICDFFSVDARILLEPIDQVARDFSPASNEYLREFTGPMTQTIPEDSLPSGFYQFTRRSFMKDDLYVRGIIQIKRQGEHTFLRGFEPKNAMAMQGIPAAPKSREYRGFITAIEDGVVATVSRRNGMSISFNYLSRVTSFQNNFWAGFCARPVRENASTNRMARLVFELLGTNPKNALGPARQAGFCALDDLMPFHQTLLQPHEPFR